MLQNITNSYESFEIIGHFKREDLALGRLKGGILMKISAEDKVRLK